MKELSWLDRIQSSDRPLIGEKAFSLGQLGQKGYPILPGFIIDSKFFREFIETCSNKASILTDLPYSSLNFDPDNYLTLQKVAKQSRQEILSATLPAEWGALFLDAARQLKSPTLILRVSLSLPSSLPPQLSGLLSSQICWCDPESLELAIKQTWAELFSAKSLFYWRRMGIGIEKIRFAILVQPISNAIASGTLQIHSENLLIQSTFGLGYSLIKGDIAPDFYQIQRATKKIETQKLGNKIRAYRLREQQTPGEGDCLETYLLSANEQESYSLDENSIGQLIALSERLAQKQPSFSAFAWTIFPTSQLYITQGFKAIVRQAPPLGLAAKTTLMKSQPLLTGISASAGQAIGSAYAIADEDYLSAMPTGSILIANTINLNWLPWLKQAAGIVVEKGSLTSHAAIIARELKIPAIVGATNATKLIHTGESLFLDANKGEVHRQNSEGGNHRDAKFRVCTEVGSKYSPLSLSSSQTVIATQLLVNLSVPSAISQAAALPVDGLGLLRSEWMLSELLAQKPLEEWLEESQQALLIEELSQLIGQFARGFAPRPVFYRSVDWRAFAVEQRGTYDYQLNPTLFKLELQALKQVIKAGSTNVNLILPFVRTVEEFSFCRHLVEKARLLEQNTFQLWIMAEVPSVIFLLPQFVQAGVRGIAIGTNDLTQLLLGVDREQAIFSTQLNACHPAMLAAIEQLIQGAKKAGIPCSICSSAPAQYPELVDRLIKWGITSISVELEYLETTRIAIARAEMRLLLEVAREQKAYGDRF
ncbi:MAG: peptide chain release factor H [Hydrococcus sp. CRU_1_1]|nr:peptide chain release factor H [Hydrococcus sp. CRU_1_1]